MRMTVTGPNQLEKNRVTKHIWECAIPICMYSKDSSRIISTLVSLEKNLKSINYELSEIKASIAKSVEIEPVIPSEKVQTKTVRIQLELTKYSFFDLPTVKCLAEDKQENLVALISSKVLPYSIALFDYLGFLKHLEKEHFQTKYKLHREISKWLNSDKEGRTVKGNISSLLKNSIENKKRYTAYIHKELVEKDYQKLK